MTNNVKTVGRTLGIVNKPTKEIRNVLKEVINDELLNIDTLLTELPSKERLEFLIKLIPYVLPKVNNVQYSLGEPLEWD